MVRMVLKNSYFILSEPVSDDLINCFFSPLKGKILVVITLILQDLITPFHTTTKIRL